MTPEDDRLYVATIAEADDFAIERHAAEHRDTAHPLSCMFCRDEMRVARVSCRDTPNRQEQM